MQHTWRVVRCPAGGETKARSFKLPPALGKFPFRLVSHSAAQACMHAWMPCVGGRMRGMCKGQGASKGVGLLCVHQNILPYCMGVRGLVLELPGRRVAWPSLPGGAMYGCSCHSVEAAACNLARGLGLCPWHGAFALTRLATKPPACLGFTIFTIFTLRCVRACSGLLR